MSSDEEKRIFEAAGRRIKLARERLGMGQEELCQKLSDEKLVEAKFEVRTLRRFENEGALRLKTIRVFANFFNVSDDILKNLELADETAAEVMKNARERPDEARPLANSRLLINTNEDVKAVIEMPDLPEPSGKDESRHPDSYAADARYYNRLPLTGHRLFGRKTELELLDECWADPAIRIVILVAFGGVGKSALVNNWLGRLMVKCDDVERVFGWSFYSQGTRDTATSADPFLDAALHWFGDTNPGSGSPWDRGERLARLVQQHRTLLVIDGLEPLQYPPGPEQGRLKELSVSALMRALAIRNPGLCVVTSRLPVADVAFHQGLGLLVHDLENLGDEAGVLLLEDIGVRGEPDEMRAAVVEYRGHALALNLLGTYLVAAEKSDVRRRVIIPLLSDSTEQGGHAKRVMASYERWFGEGPAVQMLRILGLFGKVASAGELEAVWRPPAIPDLTDYLVGCTAARKRIIIEQLRQARLVSQADPFDPEALDTHPLVREYFGQSLHERFPDSWRTGHERLYEYLCSTAVPFPKNATEMQQLFDAVVHGCYAGYHQEVFRKIYQDRIAQHDRFFASDVLGIIGSELAAISCFFEKLWSQPVDSLSEDEKAMVLNLASFRLRALGQADTAVEPARAAVELFRKTGNWRKAAGAARNVTQGILTLGDLHQALAAARDSVEIADLSDDIAAQVSNRDRLANVFHQLGQISEAERLFQEAEQLRQSTNVDYGPILSTGGHWRHCELLLDQGQWDRAKSLVQEDLLWMEEHGGPDSDPTQAAVEHMILGRVYMLDPSQGPAQERMAKAEEYLRLSLEEFRKSSQTQYMSHGLLALAALERVRGSYSRAAEHLLETHDIMKRSGSSLHEPDYLLESARLHLAMYKAKANARTSLKQ